MGAATSLGGGGGGGGPEGEGSQAQAQALLDRCLAEVDATVKERYASDDLPKEKEEEQHVHGRWMAIELALFGAVWAGCAFGFKRVVMPKMNKTRNLGGNRDALISTLVGLASAAVITGPSIVQDAWAPLAQCIRLGGRYQFIYCPATAKLEPCLENERCKQLLSQEHDTILLCKTACDKYRYMWDDHWDWQAEKAKRDKEAKNKAAERARRLEEGKQFEQEQRKARSSA